MMSPTSPPKELFVPATCSLDGGCSALDLTSPSLEVLHHETGQPASDYPLRLEDSTFFSEVLGADFPETAEYREHILGTLNLIKAETDPSGFLLYDRIDPIGKAIQALDVEFAKRKIGKEPDDVHQQWGPNAEHPYRKITLCRTTVPVKIGEQVSRFFFEKFLVVYSFLDENGNRRSTITPIHSHPYNHEVVYFLKRGPGSRAVEREYMPTDKAGAPFFSEDGVLNRGLMNPDGTLAVSNLKIRFEKEEVLQGTDEPVSLEPFASEFLSRNPQFIFQTDGLFRPHQVTIHDAESDGGTLYYAFNNYWGPLGRVIVYNDAGEPVIWSHKEWE